MQLYHPQLEALAEQFYNFAREIAQQQGKGRGRMLILYGPNGCGKTHAARALHRWFNAVRMLVGAFQIVEDPDRGGSEAVIASSIYRNWPLVIDGFKRDEWLVVESLADEYLTVIDDIGAEHDPSRVGIEKLYTILNRRENKFTIITTNVPPEGWSQKFEQRIASRFFRNSTHIDLSQVPDFN